MMIVLCLFWLCIRRVLLFKQKTAYDVRISDWSSDVCSSDLDLDRNAWELQLVSRFGWRAVIAAALADLDVPTKASDLEPHPLVQAKAAQRKRPSGVRSSLWGYMQEHTIPPSPTVNVRARRPPYAFDKSVESFWFLVP